MSGDFSVLGPAAGSRWLAAYEAVGEPGPYHHPDYLRLLAGNLEVEAERAEAAVLETDAGTVYYPYIRRPVATAAFADETDVDVSGYDDVVASWYYGGPIASADAPAGLADRFAERFREYCRDDGIVAEFVRFDPNETNHETFECLEPTFNRETVPVDLTGGPDAIWDGYEGRNQRAIKQAQETDLVVDTDPTATDVTAFHDIYSNAMAARDAAQHYRFSAAFFSELLGSDLFSLLVARYHDEVVGGFLVAHDETRSFHYLSASNPDYWDMRVNNLLYHEVVTHMAATGRDLFDFQGGRPGVFKFKKGFSPDRGEFYIGRRVHCPEVYERYVDAAAEAGVDTESGYFPAYRVEQSN